MGGNHRNWRDWRVEERGGGGEEGAFVTVFVWAVVVMAVVGGG